jgi:hypothetical protein
VELKEYKEERKGERKTEKQSINKLIISLEFGITLRTTRFTISKMCLLSTECVFVSYGSTTKSLFL